MTAGSAFYRAVGPLELDLLAALHGACFAEGWDRATMGQLLAMPGAFAYLAVAGEAPAGLALARVAADEAELLTLGVLPAHRRQGLAQGLLRAVADQAIATGVARLFLEVAADNLAAQALYRKLAFHEIGRRRRYYAQGTGPAVDALMLACDLRRISN